MVEKVDLKNTKINIKNKYVNINDILKLIADTNARIDNLAGESTDKSKLNREEFNEWEEFTFDVTIENIHRKFDDEVMRLDDKIDNIITPWMRYSRFRRATKPSVYYITDDSIRVN